MGGVAWSKPVQVGVGVLVALVIISAGIYLGSGLGASTPTRANAKATNTAGQQADATGAATTSTGSAGHSATAGPTATTGSSAGATPTATTAIQPTATSAPPPATIPSFNHVYLIMMENTWYGSVIGSGEAPYLNNTLIPSGALATNYFALTHPSAPNYWALTSGKVLWSSNCMLPPTAPTTPQCLSTAPNLSDELSGAGLSWGAYYEDMPQDCYADHNAPTNYTYTPNYNPWINYTDVNPSRCADDAPFPANGATGLASAVSGKSFAMISPNLCHDMHNCSINTGDQWLGQYVPAIQQSAGCAQSCLIIISWDEDDNYHYNHVATIMWDSAHVTAGRKDGTTYNHYALLHTIEQALGLGTLTANDRNAPVMVGMFS